MGELLNALGECFGEPIARAVIGIVIRVRRRYARPRTAPPRGALYAYRKIRSINDI